MTTEKKAPKFSPKYPYHSLKQCVQYIEKLYKKDGLAEVPKTLAMEHMGLDPKVDWDFRATSSMMGFHLLDEKGPQSKRVLFLTPIGRAIVLTKDSTRKEALQRAAATYDIIKALSKKWPDGLPSDEVVKLELIERGFTERAAQRFVSVFKETYEFGNLGSPSSVSTEEIEEESQNDDNNNNDIRATKTKSLIDLGYEEYVLSLSRDKIVKLYTSETLTEDDIDFMLLWIKRLDLARKELNDGAKRETEENDQ